MSKRFRSRMLGVVVVSACGFTGGMVTSGGDGSVQIPIDATVIDVFVPDAAPCAPGTPDECIAMDTRVRRCVTPGAPPMDEVCPGGCTTTGGPHCVKLTPTGGTVTPQDLEPDLALQDITWQLMFVDGRIDTDTGLIVINGQTVRTAGDGIRNGIYFQKRGSVGVFRMNRLAITMLGASLKVTGPNALAIVAIYDMSIIGELDLQGSCGSREAGPGGGGGGNDQSPGGGSGAGGAGTGTNTSCAGGGGGGHAATGGFGGNSNQNQGPTFGGPMITTIVGGGGGGGGGGSNGGNGGGGGGAVQLVANGKIVLGSSNLFQRVGGINAGGCGGEPGASCGGGGGAGGTILIEAAVVELRKMTLAANGGGGGGGSNGQRGDDGALSNQRPAGGAGGGQGGPPGQGGNGGEGGYDDKFTGKDGQDESLGGGGGGGVGWIRINTRSGTAVQDSAQLSPRLTTGASAPASLGTAAIQ